MVMPRSPEACGGPRKTA